MNTFLQFHAFYVLKQDRSDASNWLVFNFLIHTLKQVTDSRLYRLLSVAFTI